MVKTRRKNAQALVYIRAVAVALVVELALIGTAFRPTWGALALAVIAGVLTIVSADLGVIAAVIAIAIPLTAAQPAIGLLFLVLGIVGVRYLGADGGRAFLVVAFGVIGAFLGPAWAAAALAGYLLGVGEGALAAAIACVTVEAIGVLMGKPAIGVVLTGGSGALLDFSVGPATYFSATWIAPAFAKLNAETISEAVGTFAKLDNPAALLVQPLLWSGSAMIAGYLTRTARQRRNQWLAISAPVIAVAALAVATGVAGMALGGIPDWASLGVAAITSIIVAGLFAFVWERMFPLEVVAQPSRPSTVTMASEDADVDELLRLISTAEEKLATQHTTERVVMITDMKSFSRMTEEDGSVLTAKAIQRHRDLLMPVIQRHGGSGKSTGGDGLVAAFHSPIEALRACVEMQRALSDFNVTHPNERDLFVRIGIASGEVVLDKGGRPFIGAALNLAARVMNLADGGQSFVTGAVAAAAHDAGVDIASFGDFSLKNIAQPVEVVEVLWDAHQRPQDPRHRLATAEE